MISAHELANGTEYKQTNKKTPKKPTTKRTPEVDLHVYGDRVCNKDSFKHGKRNTF